MLAQGADGALAVDATSVYFHAKGVASVAVGGGTVTTLYSDRATGFDLALDATRVYSASGLGTTGPLQGIVACDKSGCGQPTTIATTPPAMTLSLAVDATNLYSAWGGNVMRVPVTGGASTVLASGTSYISSIAVDVTNVYWTAAGEVRKVPIAGGTPVAIAAGLQAPSALAVHSSRVYFWEDCSAQGSLMEVAIDGSGLRSLVNGSCGYVAVDDANVYFTSPAEGLVGKVALNSDDAAAPRPAVTLACGGQPTGIAVDQTSVYWTDPRPPGLVLKLPK